MRIPLHGKKARRRLLLAAFPAAAAAIGALTLPTPAQGDSAYNVTQPANYIIYNPCNGESVSVSGTEHDNLHFSVDPAGRRHDSFHLNWEGVSGVGNLGNKYQVPLNETDDFNSQVGSQRTY